MNLGRQSPASVEHVSLETGSPGSFGPTLILGNVFSKPDGYIMLTAGKINSVSVSGSAGIFLLHTDETFGGPKTILTDNEGYSTNLGRADLEAIGTGRKTRTPAASVVLFGKDKKVLWSAP